MEKMEEEVAYYRWDIICWQILSKNSSLKSVWSNRDKLTFENKVKLLRILLLSNNLRVCFYRASNERHLKSVTIPYKLLASRIFFRVQSCGQASLLIDVHVYIRARFRKRMPVACSEKGTDFPFHSFSTSPYSFLYTFLFLLNDHSESFTSSFILRHIDRVCFNYSQWDIMISSEDEFSKRIFLCI